MKPSSQLVVFSIVIVFGSCQRSPYAGRRPIGYPVVQTTTSAGDLLGNKFGENQNVTTQRIPIDALGDRELVNRVGQYPQDQQPFWLLNWQALEEHRKRPQSFNIRPSIFVDPIIPQNVPNQNSQQDLNNRNGQDVLQNVGSSGQNGQNVQQNVTPSDQNGQNIRPIDQAPQNLQQASSPNDPNRQNSEPNIRPTATIALNPSPSQTNAQQSLRTNLPSQQTVQNFFPLPSQSIQVNPTPTQVKQASWTMAST